MSNYKIYNIDKLQDKVVNQSIIAFLIIAVFAQIFVFIRAFKFGFNISAFSGVAGILFLLILYFFRKKLSIHIKVFVIIFLILLVLTSGMKSYGFLASAKLYIPIIPVFISFIFSYTRAIIALLFFLSVYFSFAILIITGKLTFSVNLQEYIVTPSIWMVESSIILLTSWGLLFVGKNFRGALIKSYNEIKTHRDNLEILVKEKTLDLETTNEELKTINEELFEKNEIIINQNQELQATLQYLKETQAQLLQSEKMASLGILTAGVSHEINNPLNYIMGAYESLSHFYKNGTLSENQELIGKLLNALKTGLDRSSAIVEGLNQFSRSSKSLNEDCNLHETIENCLNILYNQYKNHISIKKEFCDTNTTIKGNIGNLHQVFINILNNAIQAIESKGTILIKSVCSDKTATIEITDNGHGIAPENLNKVTDPFFTTRDPGKGTGLGLSITYNIIKEHNGKLEFESKNGKGTTVKIMLPFK